MRRSISRHEQIRRARGYTVTRLAQAIGYSHSYVSLVEGGLEKPSPRYREAVSAVLAVPQDLIFDNEEVTGIRRADRVSGMSGGATTLPQTPESPEPRRSRGPTINERKDLC
jgi:transcriptional regulator with XRE-family HTH domain